MSRKTISVLSVLVALSIIVSACAPATATTTPEGSTVATPSKIVIHVPTVEATIEIVPSPTPWPDIPTCDTAAGMLKRFGNNRCLVASATSEGMPEVTVDIDEFGRPALSFRRYSTSGEDKWLAYIAIPAFDENTMDLALEPDGKFLVRHELETGEKLVVKVGDPDDDYVYDVVVEKSPGYQPVLYPEWLTGDVMVAWETLHYIKEKQIPYHTVTVNVDGDNVKLAYWQGSGTLLAPAIWETAVPKPDVGGAVLIPFVYTGPEYDREIFSVHVTNCGGGVYDLTVTEPEKSG